MQNRFERCLVEHCAPTLAGIKAGSLFHYSAESYEDINEVIQYWNRRLEDRGLRVYLIKESLAGGLVYVYRPAMLSRLLSDKEVISFLSDFSYTGCRDTEAYIEQLRSRFHGEAKFPHEIGIFLGYPLHDVRGFIENEGNNCSLCGMWKVYDDRPLAEKLFAQYRKCRSIYRTMYENGSGILKLAVAA